METIQSPNLFMVACLLCLTTGCVTQKVWSGAKERFVCAPASPPNLVLFAAGQNEVLVQYDAVNPRNQQTIRRAYWLEANRSRIAAGKKPKFVDATAAEGLLPVPLLDENATASTNLLPPDVFAVAAADDRGFKLYRAGQPPEQYRLPIYPIHSHLGMRTVLTPLAVAADGALIGSLLMFTAYGGNLDAFQNENPK